MKFLFTGATGLLGRYILANPQVQGSEGIAITRQSTPLAKLPDGWRFVTSDFSDAHSIQKLVRDYAPDWVIHAGGEGNVDTVEKNPELARKTNFDSSLALLEEASRLRCGFLHFSSNAVYDGEHAPYVETAPKNPLSLYGQLKVAVDSEVRKFPGNWVIFRPTVSYGWNAPGSRGNPVSYFMSVLREGKSVKLVTDQFENPVYAGDVADAFWAIFAKKFLGEVNVGGGDAAISRYEWIRQTAEVFGLDPHLITPAKLSDFPMLVPRPKNTTFDTTCLRRELGIFPLTVREGAVSQLRNERSFR